MDISEIFSKLDDPQIYRQSGKEFYYDDYRRVLILATPEEKIRQKTTLYLEKYLNVPHDVISTEVHLRHYDNIRDDRRMDITIDALNDIGQRVTIAVVECKAGHVPITAQTLDQAFGYADTVLSDYVIATNGSVIYQYLYNEMDDSYELLSEMVDYKGMIEKSGCVVSEKRTFKRLSLSQLFGDLEKVRDYGYRYSFIGEDTPDKLVPYIANMSDALADYTHMLRSMSNSLFELCEDIGVSYLGYGNASGSDFGTGNYRSFLINDLKKGHRIVSIGIMATGKTINDPKYGNTDGKSVLITSIRDGERDETVVQINLNKFLELRNGRLCLTHNGAVTRKGARASELRDIIRRIDSDMLRDNRIFLGKFDGSRLLYMDSPDFAGVIERLITYTLIRDRYKSGFSSNMKKTKL